MRFFTCHSNVVAKLAGAWGEAASTLLQPKLRRAWLLPVLSFLNVITADRAGAQSQAERFVQEARIDQRLGEQLPLDVVVRDESGQSVPLATYFGRKPVLLSFVYFRCPNLCTQVLNGVLKTIQAVPYKIGDDYEIVSISIDPNDTPEMAAAKKERYVNSYRRGGAEQGWHFLTADAAAIERLTQAAGFHYVYDQPSDQYAHASGIMLLTPDGRFSRYFYGIDYHPNDLRLGLVESSAGKIGGPVEQFLLLCYHYDPATGRYGVAIHNVLTAACTATALALGGFLIVMFRQEKRRTTAESVGDVPSSGELGYGQSDRKAAP